MVVNFDLDADNWRKSKKFAQYSNNWNLGGDLMRQTIEIRDAQKFMFIDKIVHGRQLYQMTFNCHANSELNIVILTNHTDFSRHELTINLNGADAKANIIYLANSTMNLTDCTLIFNHYSPRTISHAKAYMVATNELAMGVLQVLSHIAKDCVDCETIQDIKGLILTPKAEIFAKPELIIDHDQITAKHGCSIGGINEAEIFYLQSRGIARENAITLLSSGFLLSPVPEILYMLDENSTDINHESILSLAKNYFIGENYQIIS